MAQKRATATATAPTSVSLRSYDVGFGDCFLLSFHYDKMNRHVLVDFGSTRLPKDKAAKGDYMEQIATEIATDCAGKLHAVVATHRHKDHISGFAMKNGKGPGAIIRALKPEIVIQPWTEDPEAARDARAPTTSAAANKASTGRIAHLRTLRDMNRFAEFATAASHRLRGAHLKETRDQLEFLGDDNELANREAIKNLMTMGKRPARYVYHGATSGLESILPGVTTRVLGPPTLEQTQSISKQRSRDADQFWHLTAQRAQFWANRAALLDRKDVAFEALFPQHLQKTLPWDARWYRYQAQREQADSLLSIVRILDNAMNNTSVILLFEVGDKRLLFPGDAQYENWMYALSQSGASALLSTVDLYKVGHHGSLNATPKHLWNSFGRRKGKGGKDRLMSFLSTQDGVHGNPKTNTEVPRRSLIDALRKESTLIDTREAGRTELSLVRTLAIGPKPPTQRTAKP